MSIHSIQIDESMQNLQVWGGVDAPWNVLCNFSDLKNADILRRTLFSER